MNIRCFIAINLPDEVRTSISGMTLNLGRADADIKWVKAENLHVTMKFLGSTDSSLVQNLKETLSKKLLHYGLFYIKIAGAGCFPSERRPRVIWAGIEHSDILMNLHRDIETVCAELGFMPEDRPFSPHVTAGRVRSQHGMQECLKRLSEFKNTDFGTVEIDCVSLIKSELTREGAIYISLADIPLGTGRNYV